MDNSRIVEGSIVIWGRNPMLKPFTLPIFSDLDQAVFDALVLRDHYLRRAEKNINFLALRDTLEQLYDQRQGRPAEEPLLMLKLEFIQYHDNLSDRQVIAKAQTDVAYRWFLGLGLNDDLPDPSLLTKFRGRIGAEGHKQIFQQIVGQARENGLVKDRLRLKDATHIIADIDVPSTLALVAHSRNRLIAAASHFDRDRAEGETARAEAVRQSTCEASSDSRLTARLTHLTEILEWTGELPAPADAAENSRWRQLLSAREVAAKILGETTDSKAKGKTLSSVDPDARRGKHGDWFDGYLMDTMIDADSELFTAINVFAAGGDEALDTLELLDQEQSAHGNKVETVSIDGAGFNGPMLRELETERGIAVIVPPPVERASGLFTPDDFEEDKDRGVVICPAGQESQYSQRDSKNNGTIYRFPILTCATCAFLSQCVAKADELTAKAATGESKRAFGRTVRKNDYKAEYDGARAKVVTPEYEAIRREHPKIERKLAELVRRHGARRARYRGLARVLLQQILCATAANIKRIVKLMDSGNALVQFAW